MQGKATFTPTDAKTGRTVKQLTEHNMITDAVKRILDPPDYTLLYSFNYTNYLNNLLPLSQSVFGGIVLLGNTLEERADNVMWNKDCIPIATAGGAYSGTNVMRGTLNANESYATENGYHFTWDFGTDKANGIIKCAALTSRSFGNTGFNDEDSSCAIVLNPENFMSTSASTMMYEHFEGQYVGTFEKHTHTYYRRISNSTELEFVRTKSLSPNSIGVNDKPSLSSYSQPISSTRITLPISCNLNMKSFLNTSTRVLYFFSDQYWNNNMIYIDYAGVSMDDFTVTETGSWPISNTVYTIYAAAIHDGKMFLLVNGGALAFSDSGERVLAYDLSMNPECNISSVNGVLCCSNSLGSVLQYYNGQFYKLRNPSSRNLMYSADILPPYYPTSNIPQYTTISGFSQNPALGLAADFFSTINNLSEPLEKTNQHTLKITYDITH